MIRKLLLGLVLLSGLSVAMAQEAPDVTVRQVTDDVVETIKSDKAIRAGDSQRAAELVEQKVLKFIDMPRMTALAVGRDWRSATPEQKTALTREFQTMIVRTYSNVLVQYKDEQIVVKPFKGKPTEERAVVNTEVRRPGAKAIAIDYELIRNADGWKVFDVIVADVSLVTNYRDSFAQEVRDRGVDGLIAALQTKNKQVVKATEGGKGK